MSSNPGKSEERSMSDILASIRKIMSHDSSSAAPPVPSPPMAPAVAPEPRPPSLDMPRVPAHPAPPEPKVESRPAAGPPPASPALAPASSPKPAPQAAVSQAPAPKASVPPAPTLKVEEPVSLDEFLAMASPAKTQAAGIPGVRPKPLRADDPVTIPLPRNPAPTPPGASAAGGPVRDRQSDPATEPVLGPPPAVGLPKSQPIQAPTPTKDMASTAPRPAPTLGDLGSVVPGRFDSAERLAGDGLPGGPERHVMTAQATGPAADPAADPAAGPAVSPARGPSLPMAPSATPVRAGPAPMGEIPGADALRKLIADVVPPSAHAPLPTPPRSSDEVVTEIVVPRAPALEAAEIKKPTADAAALKDAPKIADAVKAADAKADAPSVGSASVPKPSTPAQPIAAKASVPAPAMTQAKPVQAKPAPATLIPASITELAAKSADPAPPVATRTMDETVIELLRPLLREWLEKNMGRLIEPALKAELEALRSKLDEKPPTV